MHWTGLIFFYFLCVTAVKQDSCGFEAVTAGASGGPPAGLKQSSCFRWVTFLKNKSLSKLFFAALKDNKLPPQHPGCVHCSAATPLMAPGGRAEPRRLAAKAQMSWGDWRWQNGAVVLLVEDTWLLRRLKQCDVMWTPPPAAHSWHHGAAACCGESPKCCSRDAQ